MQIPAHMWCVTWECYINYRILLRLAFYANSLVYLFSLSHQHTKLFFNEGQQAVILVCFLCFEEIHSQHTFPAVRTHLIHHKSEEPPSISALKFEIRLGVKDMCSVYTTWTICALEQTPCCAAWRGVERWGREKGGNCHIKGKEFKINLISQSLSPPKRLTVSMLHLVLRHKQRTETAEWKRWGTHWGSRPPVN